MPTDKKINAVKEIQEWMEKCTTAVYTDYSGLSSSNMTELRAALRDHGVQFRVVKNSLANLAAEAADKPAIKTLIEGPTGIAFGYAEPTDPAKALVEFVKRTRLTLKIRGGVMGDRTLSAQEVQTLATLPTKDALVAKLMGHLQAPIAGLTVVLSGPMNGLARVLQARLREVS